MYRYNALANSSTEFAALFETSELGNSVDPKFADSKGFFAKYGRSFEFFHRTKGGHAAKMAIETSGTEDIATLVNNVMRNVQEDYEAGGSQLQKKFGLWQNARSASVSEFRPQSVAAQLFGAARDL
jgi:hypothetical protein